MECIQNNVCFFILLKGDDIVAYYSKETLQKVYDLDLYTYLTNYEPNEIYFISGNTYATRTHDSLRISNGLWYWFSQGIGGKSALDFLKLVRGFEFMDAVEFLLEKMKNITPIYVEYEKNKNINMNKKLILPPKNNNNERVISYLCKRGIDKELIMELIDKDLIYEDAKYHNVVFVGYDKYNNPKYANLRGTIGNYKGDAYGSDKSYSFRLDSDNNSKFLHIFESSIDLLSYITLLKMNEKDWRKSNFLSLAGVYKPSTNIKESKIPKVLEMYLNEHKNIKSIILHLDNDKTGREASIGLQCALKNKYFVFDNPPTYGKDYNDYLLLQINNIKNKNKEKER